MISGKILGYGIAKPAEFGEPTTITVKTNFGVEAAGILNWLKLYGTVAPHHQFRPSKAGVRSDIFETEIALRKHVEEYLPMYGQKVVVSYPGIPRMCNRCYIVGHIRRDCQNKKKDWIEFVNDLVTAGLDVELIGSWKKALDRWLSAKSCPEARRDAR